MQALALSDVYGRTYENVLYPVWQSVVHGRAISRYLKSIEQTQWSSPVEIAALQVVALRSLLAHAKRNVRYYRELFGRIGFDPRDLTEVSQLAELPVLTREIIRERYDDLVDPATQGKNIKKGTSGSTGVPLKFEYDEESESWRQATRLRAYRWAGYRLGVPAMHYWAQGAVVARGWSAAKQHLDRALRRDIYVDAIKHDEIALMHAVDVIRQRKPHVIIGYTQATALLARFIMDRGLRDWSDIPVICGAEAVLPGDREILSQAFGPEVFETYGSRETMLIAAECGAHRGLHIAEENIVFELSSQSDVIVTDLHNYAMPFIRYVNGDVASMEQDKRVCPCGRGLRRIGRVEGRRADTLIDGNGRPVPGMLFIALFASARSQIKQFQIVQDPSGAVTVRIVKADTWSQGEFDATMNRFRGYLGAVPVKAEFVEIIAPDASGKRRPVVRVSA